MSADTSWLTELTRIATALGTKVIDPMPASHIESMAREMMKHDDVKRVAELCVTSTSNLEPLFLAIKPRAERTYSAEECEHLIDVTVAVAKLVVEERKGMMKNQ